MFCVAFTADEDYIKYTSVLITSIVKNTNTQRSFKQICEETPKDLKDFKRINYALLSSKEQQEGYVFLILSNFVSEKTRAKLEALVVELSKIYPCELRICIIDEEEFKDYPKSGAAHTYYFTYYRLKAPLLANEFSKCLYLDSDMLCLCDLRELFAIDLEDKIIACVGDKGSKRRKIKFRENGLEKTHFYDENYFNAGFSLINTKFAKELFEKCDKLAKNATYIKAADQDLLNANIKPSQALKLPFAYNFVTHAFCYVICKDEALNNLNYTREEFLKSAKEPKILHLGFKPWKFLRTFSDFNGRDTSWLWWEMAEQTPCFKDELLSIKERIKEPSNAYLALGLEALKAFKSFNLFKLKALISSDFKTQTTLNTNEKLNAKECGLAILLAEVICFARERKKGVLSVILKLAKILRHYKKYANQF